MPEPSFADLPVPQHLASGRTERPPEGNIYKFTEELPEEYEHRIFLVQVLETDEFRWVVYRRE